jgi:hypothetical protein
MRKLSSRAGGGALAHPPVSLYYINLILNFIPVGHLSLKFLS